MAYEFRYLADFQYGTLTAPVAMSDTSMSSAEFAPLSANFTTTTYFPIVLLNPTAKIHEKVWVTAHSSSSSTVTVVRGRELTSARDWPTGTQWIHAPTIKDSQMRATDALPPDDPHVGQRAMWHASSESREYTRLQGWLGSLRTTQADMGRATDGTTSHTANMVPRIKMWTATGTTNASGLLAATIPNGGFTTRLLAVVATRLGVTSAFVPTIDASSTTTTIQILASNTGTGAVVSSSITVCIMAIGY